MSQKKIWRKRNEAEEKEREILRTEDLYVFN